MDDRHARSSLLRVSLITLGDPHTLTGGYLYHLRMAAAAPRHDADVRFVSFPVRRFPLPALDARRVVSAAAAGADVVVVDSIAAAFVLSGGLRGMRVPLVAMVHQPPGGIDHRAFRARVQASLDRAVYRRAARVMVASDALAEEMRRAGFDAGRVVVVPPGRDVAEPEDFLPDLRGGARAAFVCVANWLPRKGIVELLDAFAALPPDAAVLHLVGDDSADPRYADAVRARLAMADVAGRVVVHGPVTKERVAALYRAADAFVLASTREPYGTAIAEAMGAGLPVVGWDAGNLPYLARDGREGFVVKMGDVRALADALRRLADDADLRARMGAAARARANAFPTWDETAERFFDVLRKVAASR